MAGPIKTLFLALQASSFMTGVTLVYGEEMKKAQDVTLPYVVMVPTRGSHSEPGYAVDGSAGSQDALTKPPAIDIYTETLWQIDEQIDFYLWHAKTLSDGELDPDALPVDHADAIETLRLALLSAMREQTARLDANGKSYYGLNWKSLGEQWESASDAVSRFGRALVVSVQVSMSVVMAPPTQSEATVETTEFDPSISESLS